MPKPCSLDLRMRLLEAVIAGASRREAADCFDVSASSAVKWLQLWQETGSVAAKPTGGSISPLEEHADWLLALISKQSDLTLDEVVAAMRKRRIAGSRSAVWRFFKRRNISFKKKPAGGGAGASRRGPRTAALDAHGRSRFQLCRTPSTKKRSYSMSFSTRYLWAARTSAKNRSLNARRF